MVLLLAVKMSKLQWSKLKAGSSFYLTDEDISPHRQELLAVGNPCRVLREINEHDREYYFKDRKLTIVRWISMQACNWRNMNVPVP